MNQVLISGISINFPFEAYDVQKKYMEKVIECLQKASNGILESPTGTGKTLCLLCATLAWLEMRKAQQQACLVQMKHEVTSPEFEARLCNNLTAGTGVAWGDLNRMVIPKIIYSSRTHSQLSQAVQELKRSDYKYVKASVIGSRDQLCIHPEVMKESSSSVKIHMCRAKVNARTCHYYNNVESTLCNPSLKQNSVMDIEDLVKLGTKINCCPYYLSRSLKQEADMIFMPYNYLLDPKSRKAHGVELEGNVVIFDEAHNVEKMCEESVSFELSSQDIATCIGEVTQVMHQLANLEKLKGPGFDLSSLDSGTNADFGLNELCILKTLFCELEEQLDKIPLQGENNSATFPGLYIFEFLSKVELTTSKKEVILELLDKLIQYLAAGSPNPTMRRGGGLQRFADMIKVIFSKDKSNKLYFHKSAASYKVHVCHNNSDKRKQKGDIWAATRTIKQPRILNYWCFNPGIGMQNLLEESPRCILLTSGTLSPLDTFAAELQIPLPIRLENPHIIQKKQLWVGIISKGPDGSLLNSSYQNRSNLQYISSLGNTIVNFARVVPKGLLIFFPSYYLMNECKKSWEMSNIWQSIGNHKTVFLESQNRHDFHEVMEEFYKQNGDKDGRGGAFLAVCRGKVSEGLDFADDNGRAVIITGLPFPPWKDPKVTLKMNYLNDVSRETKSGSNGQEWYRLEASRAVNQAIGRVIRHKNDYGAIILCDNRFGERTFQSQLSAWLRPQVQSFPNFGTSIKSLIQFFKQVEVGGESTCRASTVSTTAPTNTKSKTSSSNPVNLLSSEVIPHLNLEKGQKPSSERISQEVDAMDWNSEKLSYSGKASPSNAQRPVQARDLFRALEAHETSGQTVMTQMQGPKNILESSCFDDLAPVVAKKRKFNVISPQRVFEMSVGKQDSANVPSAASGAVASTSAMTSTCAVANSQAILPPSGTCSAVSDVTARNLDKSKADTKTFLVNIKKYASAESYEKFRVAIRKYSQDHNLKELMDTFTLICHHPEILKNLTTFRNFVPKAQKQQYDDYMKKLSMVSEDSQR